MSKTPDPSAALDASVFDVDKWIDGVIRPEVVVELYPYELDFAAKVSAIEAQIPAAEKVTAENRGMDEASAEQLLAQIEELKAERSRTALKVTVAQITNKEIVEVRKAAKADGLDEEGTQLALIAAACVAPDFTTAQLERLRTRDRSGEQMVAQLQVAVVSLLAGLPVPS